MHLYGLVSCKNVWEMTRYKPYDRIASEYYTEARRTTRNFDAATRPALDALSQEIPHGLVLEVGAGAGRAQEYLGVEPERVVQLDSSPAMLSLEEREPALVRVCHEAEELPFPACEFAAVVGFLCDPFLGLSFLSEAFRVLKPGGRLLCTTPAFGWGSALREELQLDLMTTRFILESDEVLEVPSHLFELSQLEEMLLVAGFTKGAIESLEMAVPQSVAELSPDITRPAVSLGVDPHDLPVLAAFAAVR